MEIHQMTSRVLNLTGGIMPPKLTSAGMLLPHDGLSRFAHIPEANSIALKEIFMNQCIGRCSERAGLP
jgi:hypothetical protein